MITLYLTLLLISPQDWLGPFLGLPVDYIIYPLWLATLLATGRSKYLFRLTALDRVLGLFIVWLYVSTLANFGGGVSGYHLYMYTKWYVLYRMVAASLPSLDHLRRAAVIFVSLAGVLVFESIQHLHSASQLGWAGQSLGWIDPAAAAAGVAGRTQWVSIFDGPGVFCVVFTIALPFVLQYLSAPYGLLKRAAALVVLIPLGLAIYYTGSRGGLLAAAAIVGLHVAVRSQLSPVKLLGAGGLAASLLVAAPAYMTSIYDANRSAQHRVDMWVEGLEMVRYYPVFGVGRGNFADYTSSLIAHNSAIEIAGELGLPGLFLWVSVFVLAFKTLRAFNRQAPDPRDRAYAYALGISLAGYLVSAMFVTLEYETLYLLLGMCAAVGYQVEPQVRFRSRDAAVAATIAGIFLIGVKIVVSVY